MVDVLLRSEQFVEAPALLQVQTTQTREKGRPEMNQEPLLLLKKFAYAIADGTENICTETEHKYAVKAAKSVLDMMQMDEYTLSEIEAILPWS